MRNPFLSAILAGFLLATPLVAQDGELSDEMAQSRALEDAPEVSEGRAAYLAGEHQAALDMLLPLAEAGHPVAQNVVGAIYEDGIVVEQDLTVTQAWWEKAAAQGYDKSIYNLGWLLQKQDEGYPDDPEAALPWIERAMDIGYSHAYSLRAELHEQGRGGPVDDEAAAEHYEIAADMGVVDAMSHIGTMYINGRGVAEDFAAALYYFREAAWAGDPVGLSNLGAMYLNGYGVGQDTMAAFAFYEAGAQRGSARAAVNLGLLPAEWDTGYSDPGRAYGWCLLGVDWAGADEKPGFEEDCAYVADLVGEEALAEGEAFAEGFVK